MGKGVFSLLNRVDLDLGIDWSSEMSLSSWIVCNPRSILTCLSSGAWMVVVEDSLALRIFAEASKRDYVRPYTLY